MGFFFLQILGILDCTMVFRSFIPVEYVSACFASLARYRGVCHRSYIVIP